MNATAHISDENREDFTLLLQRAEGLQFVFPGDGLVDCVFRMQVTNAVGLIMSAAHVSRPDFNFAQGLPNQVPQKVLEKLRAIRHIAARNGFSEAVGRSTRPEHGLTLKALPTSNIGNFCRELLGMMEAQKAEVLAPSRGPRTDKRVGAIAHFLSTRQRDISSANRDSSFETLAEELVGELNRLR